MSIIAHALKIESRKNTSVLEQYLTQTNTKQELVVCKGGIHTVKGERFSQYILRDLKTTFHHSHTDHNGLIDEYEGNEM